MMPKRNKTRMKNKIRNDGLGISHAGAMVLLYPCRAYLGQEDNTVKDNLYPLVLCVSQNLFMG